MAARKRAKANRDRKRKSTTRMTTRKKPPAQAESNAQSFGRLREWLLPDEEIFAALTRHGNTSWSAKSLVCMALLWAWSESKNVTDAFEQAADQCDKLGITALSTYQGFMDALVTWTDRLMVVLWSVLHQRMQQIGGALWQVDGWVPIAFDGSRSSAPRSESNETALCAADYGQGKTAKYRRKKTKGMRRRNNQRNKPQPPQPQAWITMMWHMGLRLPWMWRLGPSNSSERAHVMQMLDAGDFPENTLFCGDAGFVGYPLWSQILEHGYHFLVRVGANVKLLRESGCRITQDGHVLSWPQEAQRSGRPPLRLRLVRVRIGKTQVWMLTSVVSSSKLTKTQIVGLYKMRWGIEVEFRGLKQTLDRTTLRCRNHHRVLAELNWSIMAMAVAELFALKEQLRPPKGGASDGPPGDPQKRSLANTIRALRRCLSRLSDTPQPGRDLCTELRQAVTDSYDRQSSKHARYRPPNPDKKPLGEPEIRKLTPDQRTKLNAISPQKTAA